MSRSRRSGGGPTRIDNSLWVRLSVTTLLATLVGAVAFLLVVRRWVALETTLAVAVMLAVGLYVLLLSPEALVVDDDQVRDASGWRRTGWRVSRADVAEVRWEVDPDIFDPPRLVFVGHDGEVLVSDFMEFDRDQVLAALRTHHWPLTETE